MGTVNIISYAALLRVLSLLMEKTTKHKAATPKETNSSVVHASSTNCPPGGEYE